ncbi:dihydrolipoyl dehydrogenase [Pseudomonas sp. NW5]|uniref:dihydrolipoyl dehydrogenase n=1 Tax=Pseudomonas sp. NW5 TaxID=2934934 RepID=UPI002022842A|nr:dihydrolipoyl dehydrogenase [Pseudomonas sp. NW5]MCL7462883.1 dihydrolipoyl dehydrogenase [Pseudomonas sp. NW5]
MPSTLHTDVAIIGAGTAGLYALREVRRAGRRFVLIDHGPLGTTCARVGCMPSKVALHAAALWQARDEMATFGIHGSEALQIDRAQTWAALRTQRDRFTASATDKARSAAGEHLLEGRARFLSPTRLEVTQADGQRVQVQAAAVVIATGSRPHLPAELAALGERVVTTDELFERDALPGRIGVLGLGAIGLEMGLALARLGVQVTAVGSRLAGIDDPQITERAQQQFGAEMTLWLGANAQAEATAQGVRLQAGEHSSEVDLLLVATGRRPNIDQLGLAEAGFALDARGVPHFDPATLQLGEWPVFIAGDANAQRTLLHEAVDEGSIAGYNAAREARRGWQRKVALGIVFSSPDLVSVGARLSELDPSRIVIGSASGQSNGRLRILGGDHNLLRLYAEAGSGRLLGASLLCLGGEHLGHLLAWAIQRGETAHSLLQLPFYHPVVEELLAGALQDIARQLPAPDDAPLGLRPLP